MRDAFLRDFRHAWRGLWKAPSFAALVILTFALGIGATTAIFSVVNAMLIAPLPYRDSSSLVFVWSDMTEAGYPRAPLSGPELVDLRERSTRFSGFGAIWATTAALAGDDGEPEQLRIGLVTGNFFSVLGADPALGRTFVEDDEPGGVPAHVLLSAALWQRRYGSDPSIVGRRIRLMGQSVTVVGVMPPDFRLLLPVDASVPDDLDAFMPFNRTVARSPRGMQFLRVVGRLRPGVTLAEAQQEVAGIASRISREFTEYGSAGRVLTVVGLQRDGVRELRAPLITLFGGVGMLLVIACLNVAHLLMARASSRVKETAVRMALGAGRPALLRQSLVEGLVLAALGGAAGLLVGQWGLTTLVALRPESLNRIASARIDPIVLAFTAGTALLWGVVFALASVAVVLRTNVASALQREGRESARGTMQYRARAALVVAQVGLGVVLLLGAGLMVRTFVALQRVDPGFRAEGRLSFRVAPDFPRFRTPEAVNSFARTLQAGLEALPGVSGAGAVSHLPFDRIPNWAGAYSLKPGASKDTAPLADYRTLSPGYLEVIGARLVAGRLFTEGDDRGAPPVAIVDERLARRVWSDGRRAVGQQLAVDPGSTGETTRLVTVVGVVRHMRVHTPMQEVREQVYFPWRQVGWSPIAFVVGTSGDQAALGPAVRRVLAGVDPQLAVYDMRPLTDYTVEATATQRFTMTLASAFAGIALALSCVGVYGLVAYSVTRRRHEFGVRLALGARPAQIIGVVLGDGMRLTVAGLAIGVAGGVAGARLLQNQLFGVSPHDVTNYAVAVSVLGASAAAACLVPAWRATARSAADVLRTE